jgi:hypothetical protein
MFNTFSRQIKSNFNGNIALVFAKGLLYRMSKMVSECMDYDSDHERMVYEINSDYFRLKSIQSVLPIIPMIDYHFCPIAHY